jgi:N-methylhydantoinase A
MNERPVRLGVDVGGTFTDVVLVTAGEVRTVKVPTTEDQSEGVIEGIRRACEEAGIEPESVDSFRHAMTVGTNALLEGAGARTALVTTEGFADVLAIGRQNRPSLYDLTARQPDPLVPAARRYEVSERASESEIEATIDESDVRALADGIDDDVESIAVSFLHAYAQPENERKAAEILREETDTHVVASHEILPEFREYERTATTVADAYVTPVISAYLGRLVDRAEDRGVAAPRVMQSSGGIAETDRIREHAVTTALSGPAAGVVGASLFEEGTDEGIITFDMGGTSTDVGLVRDGEIERTTEAEIGGYPVHVPMVAVETIGAGGGSVAWVDEGGALRVGPESAGAEPGPACYGQGGERPTVTDASLLLGYLGADTTLGEDLELRKEPATAAFERLLPDTDLGDPVAVARGVYRVATERMARAVRKVTVREGHDPRGFAIVAFGGAGPMHATALAERLDVRSVRVPRANGVLSALGLLAAPLRHDASRTIREPLDGIDAEAVEGRYERLREQIHERMETTREIETTRKADLRYAGQSHELTVEVGEPFSPVRAAERFHAAHERARGYRLPDEPVEIVTIRVDATAPTGEPEISHEGNNSEPTGYREAFFGDEFSETPVYQRDRLPAGTAIPGPAILEGGESTVVVGPDWQGTVDGRGTLEVSR